MKPSCLEPSEDRDSRQLKVLLHEHATLSEDIGRRVDLQNRNLSLTLVVAVAVSGYLIDSWNKKSFDDLVMSELVTLIPVCVLIVASFIWRHLDHDSNIVDKATYIDEVIRPKVVNISGDQSAMSFEQHLRRERGKRTVKTGVFALLGNDHFVMFGVCFVYLVFGWYLRIFESDRGGTADDVFDWLLYLASAIVAISAQMTFSTMVRYSQLGLRSED